MKPTFFAWLRTALVLSAVLALSQRLYAQTNDQIRSRLSAPDSTQLQQIILRDGSTIFGRVIVVTADTVAFQTTTAGSMQIPLGSIRDVKIIESSDIHDGSYWFPN